MTKHNPRKPRYQTPLTDDFPGSFQIPPSWEELESIPRTQCDENFLEILQKHGFESVQPKVPLRARYTRGRRWTRNEFQACFEAWQSGVSLTLISAALNRNPQDMIFRLLDHCADSKIDFTERGRSEGSANWSGKVAECSRELFSAGLPAWKIATLFQVDFEHVEKKLYLERKGYGHSKKNPFSINTSHKYILNKKVVSDSIFPISHVFDAFAGEGKTTKMYSSLFPMANILAVESNSDTFMEAQNENWSERVDWRREDNIKVIEECIKQSETFDLIDLDPFVSCQGQLELIWPLLKPKSLLFVTFGGEYRRSFIKTNRKAISRRYGFENYELSNRDYLEVVPFYFLGWLAELSASHSYVFSVLRAVRYANNCRFWLRTEFANEIVVADWLQKNVERRPDGKRFSTLILPRFAEVRKEIDEGEQLKLSL